MCKDCLVCVRWGVVHLLGVWGVASLNCMLFECLGVLV